jgi:hypothetical protein
VNPARLVDDVSAHAIGFNWLRGALAPAGIYGQTRFAALVPFVPGEEDAARDRAERIARVASRLDSAQLDEAREIARNVPDASQAVARASMGDALGDAGFLELVRFFDACERLDRLTAGCDDLPRTADAALRECARALESGRTGRFSFYLDQRFDSALASSRSALAQAQAEFDSARGRASAAVAAALDREISLPEFIVMRDDLRGPLPPGVRVVREAPTYLLCELDADEAVLATLRRRDEAATAVARAEEAVRERLSSVIRAHAAALDAAMRAFGEADVLVSAARFAQLHRCSVPVVAHKAERGAVLALEGARFLPLEMELLREGRSFTPIDLRLDDVAVLTGPNMGGKSAALRTCGFVALCAAFGVPVPARQANVALFAEIAWLGIGSDAERDGALLSSFAREVVRLRDMLLRDAKPRMVLLDEFARTTTPREGKALLVAVIRRLRVLGACGLVATHLGGVAEAAAARHYAVRGLHGIPNRPAAGDLAEALERLAASMDYTLEEVTGDRIREADAIALASLLGIDAGVIDSAYSALESE